MRTRERDAVPRSALLLVIAVAAALRLYRLGSENFWVDEVMQVRRASRSIGGLIAGLFFEGESDFTPVSLMLHNILLQLTASEALLRLPSAVFSTLDVLMVFVLTRLLLGDRVAIVASLLLAVNPLHIWYAQEMRWYALWSLLATGSYVFLVKAWSEDSIRSWVGYGVTLIVAAYTFPLTCLVMACQGASALWRSWRTSTFVRSIRPVAITHAIVGVVALPILLMLLDGATGGSALGTPRAVEAFSIPFTFFAFSAGFSVGPTIGELHYDPKVLETVLEHPIVLAYVFVAVVGGMGLVRIVRDARANHVVLPWVIGLPLLVFVVDLATGLVYNVRYALPALTPWTIAVASGVVWVGGAFGSRRRWTSWGVAAVLAFLMGYSLANYYFDPRYDKEDLRGALSEVRNSRSQDAALAVVGQVSTVAHHYGSDLSPIAFLQCEESPRTGEWTFSDRTEDTDRIEVEASRLRGSAEVWLVAGRDWSGMAERCLDAMAQTHRVAGTRHFTGTTLYRLERRIP